MSAKNITKFANNISEELNHDILLISGGIESSLSDAIMRLLDEREEKNDNLFFILTTEGGEPDAAFRMARAIQHHYESSTAVVAGWCKSAGTLVCVGANKLNIGLHGELGPLDVQLAKPDEIGGRSSGLTIDSAFRSLQSAGFNLFENFLLETIEKSGGRITTKTAAEIASGMTTGLLSPVFAQFDPNKIGEDYRSTRIAEEYSVRLDLIGKNLKSGNGFEAGEMLVRGYPSHSFVIDYTEAKQLFKNVSLIDGLLKDLVDCLGDIAKIPRSLTRNQQPIVTFLNELNSEIKENEKTTNDTKKPSRASSRSPAKKS